MYEKALKDNDAWIQRPKRVQVAELYVRASQLLDISTETDDNRIRRNGQLIWTTVVKNFRKRDKQARNQAETINTCS